MYHFYMYVYFVRFDVPVFSHVRILNKVRCTCICTSLILLFPCHHSGGEFCWEFMISAWVHTASDRAKAIYI